MISHGMGIGIVSDIPESAAILNVHTLINNNNNNNNNGGNTLFNININGITNINQLNNNNNGTSVPRCVTPSQSQQDDGIEESLTLESGVENSTSRYVYCIHVFFVAVLLFVVVDLVLCYIIVLCVRLSRFFLFSFFL